MSGRRKLVTGRRRSTDSPISAVGGGAASVFCFVGTVVCAFVAVARVFGFVVAGALGFVVSVVIGCGILNRRLLRDRQAPAGLRAGPARAPRSLGWVRGLLPEEEGMAWWAEVISCLAETSDPGERRRYLRSYRRSVPKLLWTSWAEQLSTSSRRELS